MCLNSELMLLGLSVLNLAILDLLLNLYVLSLDFLDDIKFELEECHLHLNGQEGGVELDSEWVLVIWIPFLIWILKC